MQRRLGRCTSIHLAGSQTFRRRTMKVTLSAALCRVYDYATPEIKMAAGLLRVDGVRRPLFHVLLALLCLLSSLWIPLGRHFHRLTITPCSHCLLFWTECFDREIFFNVSFFGAYVLYRTVIVFYQYLFCWIKEIIILKPGNENLALTVMKCWILVWVAPSFYGVNVHYLIESIYRFLSFCFNQPSSKVIKNHMKWGDLMKSFIDIVFDRFNLKNKLYHAILVFLRYLTWDDMTIFVSYMTN